MICCMLLPHRAWFFTASKASPECGLHGSSVAVAVNAPSRIIPESGKRGRKTVSFAAARREFFWMALVTPLDCPVSDCRIFGNG
jgi:hypothetical protein